MRYVQPRRFNVNHLTHGFLSKAGSLSLKQNRSRCEQDSNLRGKIPAGAIKLSALCSISSFQCQSLEALLSFQTWFFWHKKVSLRAGTEPAREDPIGFRVQRLNHSAITSDAIRLSALCSTSSFQWNHLTHGYLSKAGSLSLTQKRSRCEQESNLRVKIPLDFESNALTTWPSQLVQLSWARYVQPRRFNVNHLKHCFLSTVVFFWHKKVSLLAGVKPAREDPIEFRVQRLNHSAIA